MFFSCKKGDDGPTIDPPVTEPLSIAAAKPGDTLYIKGDNFSTEINKNTVKINGVDVTVIMSSSTEIKAIIPDNATSGSVTVTVNGKTTEVGNLTIVPAYLFSYKRDYQTPNIEQDQIYTLDPVSGQAALFFTRQDTMGSYLNDMVYVPATNELIGIVNGNRTLFRLNITSKQVTFTTLIPANTSTDIMELVVDKFSNLYSVKRDWTNPDNYLMSLMKVDLKTGSFSAVKTISNRSSYWSELVYLAGSNEIAGMIGNNELFKLNLTTKDTATVLLPLQDSEDYRELAVDNQGGLYGFKRNWATSMNPGQIVKLNSATGKYEPVMTFNDYHNVSTNFAFIPKRNELVTIWEDGSKTSIWRLNVSTKNITTVALTSQPAPYSVDFDELTTN